MQEIFVSEIWSYPIKATQGIAHEEAEIDTRGIVNDRRWLVTDLEGKFLTQREFPRLALVASKYEAQSLQLSAPQMPNLQVSAVAQPEELSVTIWETICQAQSYHPEADAWLSEYLQTPCRLVYMPETSRRQVDLNYAQVGQITSFTDAFPFLLISEASLLDLNRRMEYFLPMNRFRPNLVVSGALPFAEDTWKLIRIGSILFEVAKPCARCTVTTVDQATAERGKEPLKTLATFRQLNNKIYFGQNLLHLNLGKISVGQKVEILELNPQPICA
ncbi:MAG: MOSC domain-containing protein [Microscillaceae bacterium]|nr:MOSC domain-containing protein [Microscillaceae bacterium]